MATEPHSNGRVSPVMPMIRKSGHGLLSATDWHHVSLSLKLSKRETEVVQCVFDDLKESAIASQLGISAHTVHTHLERLYRKLNVSSRCGLVLAVVAEFHRISGFSAPEPSHS